MSSRSRSARSARDLPPGYYRQLPKLAGGPFAGYPRVFGLAWAFVAHTDSLFDPEMLRRYVRAYQEVQPLTIGELWAVAISLRIVLVENLRRIADADRPPAGRAAASRRLADRLLGASGLTAEPASEVLAGQDPAPPDRGLRRRSWCSGCATRTPASPRPSPGSTSTLARAGH